MGKRPTRYRNSQEMRAFLRRMTRAMVARAAEGDITALTALRDLQGDLDEAIGDAARALYEYPDHSWTVIGNELGITRQAALKRFGPNATKRTA